MSTSTWYVSFQNRTATPIASVSISNLEITSSGSLSSHAQWVFLSLPANGSPRTASNSFEVTNGMSNDWSIVVTDQNNRAFGTVVHSAVGSSGGTVAFTLTYDDQTYTMTIQAGSSSATPAPLAALTVTYGF